MEQIIAHMFGDYILQSDWMAINKSKKTWPCVVHVVLYTACFLFITTSVKALVIIAITHFVIDRFGLARYLVWLKNHIAPKSYMKTFKDCDIEWQRRYQPWRNCTMTGYDDSRPVWLTVWLTIAADNTLHLLCNYAAVKYF